MEFLLSVRLAIGLNHSGCCLKPITQWLGLCPAIATINTKISVFSGSQVDVATPQQIRIQRGSDLILALTQYNHQPWQQLNIIVEERPIQ